jgi:hypothetical protein
MMVRGGDRAQHQGESPPSNDRCVSDAGDALGSIRRQEDLVRRNNPYCPSPLFVHSFCMRHRVT